MHSMTWTGKAWTEGDRASDEVDIDVTIQHNGDFSGNVHISVPTYVGAPQVRNFTEGGEDHHIAELHVPYEALEALVIRRLRYKIDSALDTMTDEQFIDWMICHRYEAGSR